MTLVVVVSDGRDGSFSVELVATGVGAGGLQTTGIVWQCLAICVCFFFCLFVCE